MSRQSNAARFDRSRFDRDLPSEGRDLVRGWFKRAKDEQHVPDEKIFEPFSYLWFSFNGWASCVTALDYDHDMINSLKDQEELKKEFDDLVKSCPDFKRNVESFQACWPIFSVKKLRELKIHLYPSSNRTEAIDYYLEEITKTTDN